MTRYGMGYIESPPDPRDFSISKLLGIPFTVPAESHYDLIPLIDGVLDQKTTSSCVWNAIAQAHYIRQGVQLKAKGLPESEWKRRRMSRLFGYFNTRLLGGNEAADIGCQPRLAWQAAKKFGFCPEELWPFNTLKVNSKPIFDAFQGAADQQWVRGYYQLFGTTSDRVNEVKNAIKAGYPVVFGTIVDEAFTEYEGSQATLGVLDIPKGPLVGRHMMCAPAYNANGLFVLNSWGKWGRADPTGRFPYGWFQMSWNWVNSAFVSDVWALDFAEEFSS